MSNSLVNDSNDQIAEQDQAQCHVPTKTNKEEDNLDIWLDNFLAETRNLDEKKGDEIGESSEKKLSPEEKISAWADKVLNGESADQDEDDGSQDHQNDSEGAGNIDNHINPQRRISERTRSSISTLSTDDEEADESIEEISKLTPVGPFEDKNDDDSGVERESNPTDGESGNTLDLEHDSAASPSLPNRNSRSSTSVSMDGEENEGANELEQDADENPKDMFPASIPDEPFEGKDDDSGTQLEINQSDDESENAGNTEEDPTDTPSPSNRNSRSSISIISITSDEDSKDDNEQEIGEEVEPSEKNPESFPVISFFDEVDGSEKEKLGNQSDSESESAANGKHDPATTLIPSLLDPRGKQSWISIPIYDEEDDGDEPAWKDEHDGEIRESTPIEPFDNEDDSSRTGISSNGTDGESVNAAADSSPTPNPKPRSSISISDEEGSINQRTRIDEPDGKVRKSTPVEPFDNEDSGRKITRGKTDGESESDNAGNTQPEPDPGTSRSPDNCRKRSSTSITIISDNDEPGESTPETTPAKPNDNQDDYSALRIYDASDWDEIDLNSESDEEEEKNNTSNLETPTRGVNNAEYASYLKAYVDSMYIFGVSTRDGDGKSCCGKWNLILFFFVVFVALLQTFQYIKDVIVTTIKEHILLRYIQLGYSMNVFLFRGYFAYLMIFKPSDLAKIIKSAQQLGRGSSKIKAVWMIGLLVLTSWMLGLAYPIIRIISRLSGKWVAEDIILTSSYDFAHTWLAWNQTTIDNDTDTLWETYGMNMTNNAILMGATGIAIEVLGFIYEFLIKDLAFVAAFTMYIICTDFSRKLSSYTKLSQEFCDDLWEHYKLMRTFSKLLNDLLEQLFQLFHVENTLFTAYVSFEQFFVGGDLKLGLLETCILAKWICFYVLAAKASSVNRKFEQWVRSSFRDTHTLFIENSQTVTTQNLLDEIKSDPIGIGRGMFFIDGSFLWKFVSIVGSFFVFFTEKRQMV